jgi:[CysO sulfur-carrier protein]-S-L-cysteine hydrolase
MDFASPMLRLTPSQYQRIVAHCLDAERDESSGLLYEACGLLAGPVRSDAEPTGKVTAVYPCKNADASAKTYTVDSRDLLHAMRDADTRGDAIVGVWHSHTHTRAYPSETDVRQAPDPTWLYAIVSLIPGVDPVLRAYRIRDGEVAEVQVVLDSA